MTIEEAIKNRERCLRYLEGCGPQANAESVEAVRLSLAALREKAEREKSEPLTLDELRQMDGEPVWVQSPGVPGYGRWAIVAGVDTTDGDKILFLDNDLTCIEYGEDWLAYRHKPKEAK